MKKIMRKTEPPARYQVPRLTVEFQINFNIKNIKR